jgi:tetratricopeptide (TPR) repeat protein
MHKRFTLFRSFTARAGLLALLLAVPALAQIAEGDRHWAARAEGSQNGRAKAAPIDAAIAAYQRALAQNPNDVEAHWKLLRAMRFKGAYVASTNEEKKKIYGAAKIAGDKALALANRLLGVNDKTKEQQVAAAARKVPGTAEIFLWDAVNWGEWALAYGKMAAAREGAADRIRREATIAHLADPALDGGTPARVLGRLHDQTPRIPFITGWASSKEAVKFLTESLKVQPQAKITTVFLAEAMVANDSKTKAQAVKMLRDAIAAPNDGAFLVENAAATEDAKALLRKWGV